MGYTTRGTLDPEPEISNLKIKTSNPKVPPFSLSPLCGSGGAQRSSFDFDTFDGAKPRFKNRGKKRRSVSTLSIPRASDRGVEWVDS